MNRKVKQFHWVSKMLLLMLCIGAATADGTASASSAPAPMTPSVQEMSRFDSLSTPAFGFAAWSRSPIWYETIDWAGSGVSGSADGRGEQAQFRYPAGLLADKNGALLIADTYNHLIRRADASGRVATLAGQVRFAAETREPNGSWADGKGTEARFNRPMGMAEDRQGNLYIADAANHVIRKLDKSGRVTTVAGSGLAGWKDGTGTEARFNEPRDVAVAEDGSLYVADALNHVIRRIDANGNVTTLNARSKRIVEYAPGAVAAGGDYADGKLAECKFNEPSGLAFTPSGDLVVSDTGNQRLRLINLKQKRVTTLAGAGSVASYSSKFPDARLYAAGGYRDGKAGEALFNGPAGIAITAEGGIVVADRWNHAVRYIYEGKVYTLSGGGRTGHQNGWAEQATFREPIDVAVLSNGTIAVADGFNNSIRLFRRYTLPEEVRSPSGASPSAQDAVIAVYNDRRVETPVPAVIRNNRAFLPLEPWKNLIGYGVEELESDKVRVTFGPSVLILERDLPQVQVERSGVKRTQTLSAEEAPFRQDGQWLIPARLVDQFGLHVNWVPELRTLILRDTVFGRHNASGEAAGR
ncbi:copper amine oxidase [Paenibacillus melissococcoides]|uniref:Copper amine oxidase n=1 Tax=Paenibacillus melissococcoides TaxID=2912268 RepID=A0ABN8UC71_9BACL|nr:copper amine oxidase [Paenibacillus melissococcoides]CAH8247046.1 copper amine oxidase [Paenibacillus melissococcoides]CAH8716582.1 copper amine oxidase [Paenibacillus melissococcoides]CAH8717546.1 copper amine oxidase [Paenibacillus melissococcoides]